MTGEPGGFLFKGGDIDRPEIKRAASVEAPDSPGHNAILGDAVLWSTSFLSLLTTNYKGGYNAASIERFLYIGGGNLLFMVDGLDALSAKLCRSWTYQH